VLIATICCRARKEDDARRMEGLRKVVQRTQKKKDQEFQTAYKWVCNRELSGYAFAYQLQNHDTASCVVAGN
jgi:hypothetical protein